MGLRVILPRSDEQQQAQAHHRHPPEHTGHHQAVGTVLTGGESVQECGQRIFDLMLRTASGEPTKSEALGFGAQEFAPWMLGATM